jgi:hypothetical protein
MGRGPLMVYHGQEVGEPAVGSEGFAGDDGRTSIFDYWSMPEFQKWVNGGKYDGGRMSAGQTALREWYRRLLAVVKEPPFADGEFYGLNHANKDNPAFGRVGDESISGHWLYAYLRHDPATGRAMLVVANFHGSETLRGVRIRLPEDALGWLEWKAGKMAFRERLTDDREWLELVAELPGVGALIGDLEPLSARILELGPVT